MPKGKLIFNLPEEQTEFDLANDASRVWDAMWDFKEWLSRLLRKGDPNEVFKDPEEATEKIFEKLIESCEDRSINWDRYE